MQPYVESVVDYSDSVESIVTGKIPGYELGDHMTNPRELHDRLVQGNYVRPAGKNPEEIKYYRKLGPDGVAAGPMVPKSNREFRSDKRFQLTHVPVGETKTVMGPGGDRRLVGDEFIQTGGDVGPDIKYAPKAHYDAAQGGDITYPTAEMLMSAAPGRYTPREDTTREVTEKDVDRAVAFKQSLGITQHIVEGLQLVGTMGMGAPGKIGVAAGNLATYMGMPGLADKIAKVMGAGDLTMPELGQLQDTLKAWVNQHKMIFLNDQRISKEDQTRLDSIVSINKLMANKEQMLAVVLAFTEWDLIRSELAINASGKPPQFPVRTAEEFNASIAELEKFSIPTEAAERWATNLMNYPELQ